MVRWEVFLPCWGPSLSPIFHSAVLSFFFFFLLLLFFFFCLLSFFKAAPTAYGGSQARGRIGAVAAGLCHNHSNTRSKPCLQPKP